MSQVLFKYLSGEERYSNKGHSSIILPGRKHEDHEYPDLLVSMERNHLGETHAKACKVLNEEKSFALNLRYGADFLQLLTSNEPVYNGAGKKLRNDVVNAILEGIVGIRNPWRGEFLNDRYIMKDGVLCVVRDIVRENKIVEVTQPLGECLMQRDIIGLEYWLRTANYQGLPTKERENRTGKGGLFPNYFIYWQPREDSTARFGVDWDDPDLDCSGSPRESHQELGVRRVKILEQ